MTIRLLCLLALACSVGYADPAFAQGDIENPFAELLDESQDQETETPPTRNPHPPAIQDQETETPPTRNPHPPLVQDQETEADPLDADLADPFANPPMGQDQETEAPLDRDPESEQDQEEEVDESQLTDEQRQEVEDIAQTGDETADTIEDMEDMSAEDVEALVESEERLAEEEIAATQEAMGAASVLQDRVANGEPGYGTMIPVPEHENSAVADDADDEGGTGMHSFWERLLDGALQGVVDGFQRRYAVAKLNHMKARADRVALLGKSGDRPVVNGAVRNAVRQTGLTRLGNSDPRLSDLMLGNTRTGSNPLRATSGGPSGTGGNQVSKIDQYRLPTAHDKITGKPLMRNDGVTPIKTVNLPLGAPGGAIPLRRR